MDIYEFAMKMEKDGEAFYRELVDMTDNKGLKSILGMLADAEVRHFNLFRNMKQHAQIGPLSIEALLYVKNIFEIMKEQRGFKIGSSEMELYRKAQDIEQKSREFYLKEASEVSDPSQKDAFAKIANEEQRHFMILEEIMNMVDRPQAWLENPEWYHLEEY
jgi:rubrerythrin